MLNTLQQFDSQISAQINNLLPHNHFFDIFFNFLSSKIGSVGIWVTILFVLLLFVKKIDKKKLFVYLLVISLITAGLTQLIKHTVKRNRPEKTYSYSNVSNTCNETRSYSFPSGHASSALAAAATFAYFDKKRKYFYFLVAGLIGISRIYLQCHYLLDLITGGLLGILTSFIFLLKLNRKS